MAGISGRHDFGDELVRQEVLTREELDAIMEQEAVSGVPWYRQLLQKEIISVGALEDLFRFEYHSKAKRQLDESIGATLVKMGEISKDNLKAALAEQKRINWNTPRWTKPQAPPKRWRRFRKASPGNTGLSRSGSTATGCRC